MKTRLFIFVAVFFTFTGSVFYGLQSLNMHINLHSQDIHQTHHTYRIYNSWLDSVLGKNPIDSCDVPIMPNGNYIGNPTTKEMRTWMNTAEFDISKFDAMYLK